jgi:hypothetical protein
MFSHIAREIRTHLIDYLVLVSASVVFLLFLRIFQGQRLESFLTILIFASFYTMWGIVHHTHLNTLKYKNVVEYVAVSFLMLALCALFFSLI